MDTDVLTSQVLDEHGVSAAFWKYRASTQKHRLRRKVKQLKDGPTIQQLIVGMGGTLTDVQGIVQLANAHNWADMPTGRMVNASTELKNHKATAFIMAVDEYAMEAAKQFPRGTTVADAASCDTSGTGGSEPTAAKEHQATAAKEHQGDFVQGSVEKHGTSMMHSPGSTHEVSPLSSKQPPLNIGLKRAASSDSVGSNDDGTVAGSSTARPPLKRTHVMEAGGNGGASAAAAAEQEGEAKALPDEFMDWLEEEDEQLLADSAGALPNQPLRSNQLPPTSSLKRAASDASVGSTGDGGVDTGGSSAPPC